MYAYFEQSIIPTNESTIQCLSWMGKVSSESNRDKDWKCDRFLYYQDGWLATGGTNCIVGSTFTSCCSNSSPSKQISNTQNSQQSNTNSNNSPSRTNFNLRGHKSEIKLVKWNEPYQKLASCDGKGVIYVWVKYEGRWSIELINDRGKIVSDFAWSHDGRMAAICYEDGFVLVGSVNGQRFWSHLFDLNNSFISSITWTPDDSLVLLGLSSGTIMIIDKNGTYINRVSISNDGIIQINYNSQKFFMDEDSNIRFQSNSNRQNVNNNDYLLACSFHNNDLVNILRTYDDIDPISIKTNFQNNCIKFEWSNCGSILAIGGYEKIEINANKFINKNFIKFYNKNGNLLFKFEIPNEKAKDELFTALTWGHNDERLFISTTKNIYVSVVIKEVASCSLLAQLRLRSLIQDKKIIDSLNLPIKLKYDLKQTYKTTIKNIYPNINELRKFVCTNSKQLERLHCTMKRNNDEHNDDYYILYLEYLGNLIPLLKAKKCSKIKPNFVIYDPYYTINSSQAGINNTKTKKTDNEENDATRRSSSGYSSDTDSDIIRYDSLCGSPKAKTRHNSKRKNLSSECKINNNHKLVEITSNLWGTKFKFHGINHLPLNIGSITYKTSLFHLQPRQMKIIIKDLSKFPTITEKKSANLSSTSTNKRKFLSFSKKFTTQPDFKSIINDDSDDEFIESNTNNNNNNITKINIANIDDSDDNEESKEDEISSDNENSNSDSDNKKDALPAGHTNSSLIVYPLADKKQNSTMLPGNSRPASKQLSKEFSLTNEQTKLKRLSSNNVSTLSASNDLAQLPFQTSFISRPTSPANLIRPISPPAIQIKEPIASPRVITRHLMAQSSKIQTNTSNNKTSAIRLSSSASLNSPSSLSINNNNEPSTSKLLNNKLDNSLILNDTNSCDSEVNNYLTLNNKASTSSAINSCYTTISENNNNKINEIKNFKSLISCLDPTTNHDSNRVLLLDNMSNKSNNMDDSFKNNDKKYKKHKHNKSDNNSKHSYEIENASNIKIDKLSFSDPILASTVVNFKENNLVSSPSCASSSTKSSKSSTASSSSSSSSSSSKIRTKKPANTPNTSINTINIEKINKNEKLKQNTKVYTKEFTKGNKKSFNKENVKQKLQLNKRSKSESFENLSNDIEYIMHNKPPIWNQANQVYQLDFGGRVTQESAKNFQIECNGKQVMQFGRIDGNAYTLDFEWPFTVVQAFAIALANITQRLK